MSKLPYFKFFPQDFMMVQSIENKKTEREKTEGDCKGEKTPPISPKTPLSQFFISLTEEEKKKLNEDLGSTEAGKKILEQCMDFFRFKGKRNEIDIDQNGQDVSHFQQITGWVLEYVKTKPGYSFIFNQHKEQKQAVSENETKSEQGKCLTSEEKKRIRQEFKKEQRRKIKLRNCKTCIEPCNSQQGDSPCLFGLEK